MAGRVPATRVIFAVTDARITMIAGPMALFAMSKLAVLTALAPTARQFGTNKRVFAAAASQAGDYNRRLNARLPSVQ